MCVVRSGDVPSSLFFESPINSGGRPATGTLDSSVCDGFRVSLEGIPFVGSPTKAIPVLPVRIEPATPWANGFHLPAWAFTRFRPTVSCRGVGGKQKGHYFFLGGGEFGLLPSWSYAVSKT